MVEKIKDYAHLVLGLRLGNGSGNGHGRRGIASLLGLELRTPALLTLVRLLLRAPGLLGLLEDTRTPGEGNKNTGGGSIRPGDGDRMSLRRLDAQRRLRAISGQSQGRPNGE
jgi:hypothetical protein